MKLNILAPVIFCLIFCDKSFAQHKQNVYFLKNNGKRVDVRDSADYIRIVSEPDPGSELFNVEEFYKDNKLRFKAKSSRPDPLTLEGEAINYYPSGIKRETLNYKEGKRVGDAYLYYANGKLYTHRLYLPGPSNSGSFFGSKSIIIDCADSTGKALATNGNGYFVGYSNNLKDKFEEGPIKDGLKQGTWKGRDKSLKLSFTEKYDKDTLVLGTSVDDDKKTYSYNVREAQPQFVGGLQAFSNYLGKNVRYPASAKENNVQGTVFITFVVEKDGELVDHKVQRSPRDDLSAEALRVLKQSPKWMPGTRYGKPVRVAYIVPIRFQYDK